MSAKHSNAKFVEDIRSWSFLLKVPAWGWLINRAVIEATLKDTPVSNPN